MAPLFTMAIFLLVLDRFSKILFYNYMSNSTFSLLGGILKLRLATNENIAFSIPFSGVILEVIIGLVLILLIIGLIKYAVDRQFGFFILVLVIFFGAASNFYDRLVWGFVVDYIDLKWFTVFNIADMMIVISGILLIYKIKTGRGQRPLAK